MSEDGAEIIAIDEHAAFCLVAAQTGNPLRHALVDGTTLEALTTRISELYDGATDRLAEDVDRLLAAYASASR
ncbi:MAG TPA: hypothetical protein VNS09_14155 [Solirubrobacter sp.]|nr:hypothetical protein [Solirubrobacter sp.]